MTDDAGGVSAHERPVGRPVPARRDDGMPTSDDERYLRRLLAYRVAMPHTYYDDGEAHGTEHGISIDFMREPVADIDAKLRALNVARMLPPQVPNEHGHLLTPSALWAMYVEDHEPPNVRAELQPEHHDAARTNA